jgi:hypothetical protein
LSGPSGSDKDRSAELNISFSTMSDCALDDRDAYVGDAGDSDQMEKGCRTDITLVEDAASRKKLQNRIAQRTYRKLQAKRILARSH